MTEAESEGSADGGADEEAAAHADGGGGDDGGGSGNGYDRVLVDAECTTDGSAKHMAKLCAGPEAHARIEELLSPSRIEALLELQRYRSARPPPSPAGSVPHRPSRPIRDAVGTDAAQTTRQPIYPAHERTAAATGG